MKDKIRKILREGVLDGKIKRILIFDFDGTLIDTATPDNGKPLWFKEFKFEWPFAGWWGRRESLDSRLFFKGKEEKIANDLKGMFNENEIRQIIQKGLIKNIFSNSPIASTVSDYHRLSSDNGVKRSDTLVILLTGRHSGVGDLVTKILNENKLTFDDYIYKTGSNETHEFKKMVLDELANKNPNLEEMQIWEDRHDHVQIFKNWANKQKFNVKIHQV